MAWDMIRYNAFSSTNITTERRIGMSARIGDLTGDVVFGSICKRLTLQLATAMCEWIFWRIHPVLNPVRYSFVVVWLKVHFPSIAVIKIKFTCPFPLFFGSKCPFAVTKLTTKVKSPLYLRQQSDAHTYAGNHRPKCRLVVLINSWCAESYHQHMIIFFYIHALLETV